MHTNTIRLAKAAEAARLSDKTKTFLSFPTRLSQCQSPTTGLSCLGIVAAFLLMLASCAYGTSVQDSLEDASSRCGAVALDNLVLALKGTNASTKVIDETIAPLQGFSMTELAQLSAKAGLDLVAVQRQGNEPLVVPSIIHWRYGHYSAIIEKKGGRYRILDSVLGSESWVSENVISEASSGNFLVPAAMASPGWKRLTQQQSDHVIGRGQTMGPPDTNDPPPCPKSGCCGMPVWSVTEPYINLWLQDEPMGYNPGVGDRISFQLNYKQREANAGFVPGIFNCGPMWNFSWLSYITNTSGGTNPLPVQMNPAGGGSRTYSAAGQPEYYTSTEISLITNVGSNYGYIVNYPNGAMDYYNYSFNSNQFLTEKVDPAGHVTQFVYKTISSGLILQYVIDADGRTNGLVYTNTSYPLQITSVTNAFGQTVNLFYDGTTGLLTNIIDVAGISNTFMYSKYVDDTVDGDAVYGDDMDGSTFYWITNLTTPYGTTSFYFADPGFPNDPNGNTINRSVMVVDPMGGTNLFLYRDYSSFLADNEYSAPTVPNGPPLSTFIMQYRNSWHWGPLQFANLSTNDMNYFTTSDYLKGRQRNWMHDNANFRTVSDALNMQQDPSPDGGTIGLQTWYAYPGEVTTGDNTSGTNAVPILTAYNLPDGNVYYNWITRDNWGHPTNIVEPYSLGFDTPPLSRTNVYIYTNGVDLVQHIGPNGETVAGYSYDTNHNVLTMTNAVGDVTTNVYDANSRLTTVYTPAGLTTTYTYYSSGSFITNWVQQRIDVQIQRTNSYSYTNDLIYAQTNELGLATTNTWDNLQRLTGTTFPDGTYISNIYSRLDRVETIDRLGYSNEYVYDGLRRLIAVTNALGNVTRYDYCICGALEDMEDMLGNYTHYHYDFAGRLTNIAYPDGSSLTNFYNPLNQVTNTVDGAGVSITNWFNDQGRLYASSNAFGQVFLKEFDIEDRVTNSVDGNGVVITNSYDNLGRLLTRGYPDGGIESFGYSPAGLIAYTNQLTNVTYYAYDAARRKVAETNALTNVTQYAYDAASDLVNLTDQNNDTTKWGYDVYGRMTSKTDATNTIILTNGYDADNRLTNHWSIEKGNTTNTYDAVGNLTGVTYPSNHTLAFLYDAMNRQTSMSDGIGTTLFAYTPIGQLQSETGPWPSDVITYTYTNRMRTNLALQQPGGSNWAQSYVYDAASRLQSNTSPAGAFGYQYVSGAQYLVSDILLPNTSVITNNFDANGRLTQTSLMNSVGGISDDYVYSYNQAGERTACVRSGGIPNYANYTYDPIGEVTSDLAYESISNTTRLNEQLHYVFDPAGNLINRTNNALIQNFQVNSLNELTNNSNSGTLTVMGATTPIATNVTVNGSNAVLYGDYTFAAPNMPLTNSYTALAVGNGVAATNVVTVNLATNAVFQYDRNGNLTNDGLRNLVYDDENQLIQVSVSNQWMSRFVYDGRMRRRIRQEYTWQTTNWAQTNAVYYVYDGNLVIQERDTNDNPLVTYTRGQDLSGSLQGAGGIGGLLARTDTNGSAYYHADGNGNITMLINSFQAVVAQYLYDAFGNILLKSGSLADANRYQFSSKEKDRNSGLVYYLYRYYDPNLQRWLNRDPIGEMGKLNLYEFVGDDPITKVDSLGLCKVEVRCGTVVGGFVHCGLVVNGKEYGIGGDKGKPGAGNSISGGGASLFFPGGIPPTYANPAGPPNSGQKSYPASCDGSCDCIAKKFEDFQKNNPPPNYAAISGPNSNTYAHRMLNAAGCNVDPITLPSVTVQEPQFPYPSAPYIYQPPPTMAPPGALNW